MTEKEQVARLIELTGGLLDELNRRPDCEICHAVKLRRIKTLVDNLYANHEEYLDGT